PAVRRLRGRVPDHGDRESPEIPAPRAGRRALRPAAGGARRDGLKPTRPGIPPLLPPSPSLLNKMPLETMRPALSPLHARLSQQKGGVPMRFALLAVLLPTVAVAGEGNEAEKLFRQMEKQIASAKSLRLASAIDFKSSRGDRMLKSSLTFAP